MMSYDYLYDSTPQRAELFSQKSNLRFVDATTFKDRRTCGIHACNNHFVVFINGLEISSDVALVFCQRLKKTGIDIVKRNVMIPRHHYLWLWQSIEERTRMLELVRAGALCEVAGDGDDIRFNFSDDF